MPKFLSQDEVYRILQRELPPDDVYPDGAPSAFFSTADQYSTAKLISDAYLSASGIYEDQYPISALTTQAKFEIMYFGYSLDGALSEPVRRAQLLAKIRTLRRTAPADMKATVYSVINPSILVEIVEWGHGESGWMLDVSELEISTYLNEFNGLERVGSNLCQLGPSDYGLTADAFARLQAQAYTYEVRIYGYTLSSAERTAIDAALNAAEPARSLHVILDGLDPNDAIAGNS